MDFVLLACEILSSTVETFLFICFIFSFKSCIPSYYDVLFMPIQQSKAHMYILVYSIYLITLKF